MRPEEQLSPPTEPPRPLYHRAYVELRLDVGAICYIMPESSNTSRAGSRTTNMLRPLHTSSYEEFMTETERQAAINDLLKYCHNKEAELGVGRALSLALLGREWRHIRDDWDVAEAIQSLIEQGLVEARHHHGPPQPVAERAVQHQQDIKQDINSHKSVKIWSVLWAYYSCQMSAKQIGDICGWTDRMSQHLLSEGRVSYLVSLIAQREAQYDQQPRQSKAQTDYSSQSYRPDLRQVPQQITPASTVIDYLRRHIVADKQVHDLSENPEFASFGFIGYRRTAVALEFLALVAADGRTERQIVDLRKQYFEIVKRLPGEFGFKPRGHNPNGLLSFVYTTSCTQRQIAFIKDQSQVTFTNWDGGVVISWTLDMQRRQIHTHHQLVSALPPMFIATRWVFPGLAYLQSLIERYPG